MHSYKDIFSRAYSVFGDEAMSKLKGSHVVVFGLGGVGSYCCAALARNGVGQISIVDFDKVCASNVNRQLFANISSVGELKTELAEEYLKDINPQLIVNKYCVKAAQDNIANICSKADYVIDCIDEVPVKVAIAKLCEDKKINLISCMGTALRLRPELLEICDLYETSTCPLCRKIRHEARAAGVSALKVLYSKEEPAKSLDGNLGSTSFVPPVAGLMLAGEVIKAVAGKTL